MGWSLLDSGVATFADAGSGHAYSYPGGAPSNGDLLVLGVNSDTVVSTPSGWTSVVSAVSNQGAYVFVRQAGAAESSSVTVTTSGNFNTALSYRRYSGHASATPEQTASAQVNGSAGIASPAVSPAALAGSGRLCLLYSMNHAAGSAPASPVPSSGYSVVAQTGMSGSGASGTEHLVLSRTDGSGSETPSVTWTDNGSNAFSDRYALFVAFAPSGAATGTAAATLPAVTAAAAGTVTVPGVAAASLGGLTGTARQRTTVDGVAAAALGGLEATMSSVTPLSPDNDLVGAAWIAAVSDSSVATDLPASSTWGPDGFTTIAVVGGTPNNDVRIAAPVFEVTCWAPPAVPGSTRPQWRMANARAEVLRAAVLAHRGVPRLLTGFPAAYAPARVLSAMMLSEPRRVLHDEADYAGYSFDLQLWWTV